MEGISVKNRLLAATSMLSLIAGSLLLLSLNKFWISVNASKPVQKKKNQWAKLLIYYHHNKRLRNNRNSYKIYHVPFCIFCLLSFPRGISVILISNSINAALELTEEKTNEQSRSASYRECYKTRYRSDKFWFSCRPILQTHHRTYSFFFQFTFLQPFWHKITCVSIIES